MPPLKPFKRLAPLAFFLAVVAGTARADAATKTMPLSALQTLVGGLGLEDAGNKTSYVEIDNQGPRSISIVLRPVDDDKYVQFYTRLAEVPKDKISAMPSNKMLEYNDNHTFYFTIGGTDDNLLFLQARLDAATVTPQLLRQQIDELVAAVDDTAGIWDAANWKAGAAPAAKP